MNKVESLNYQSKRPPCRDQVPKRWRSMWYYKRYVKLMLRIQKIWNWAQIAFMLCHPVQREEKKHDESQGAE